MSLAQELARFNDDPIVGEASLHLAPKPIIKKEVAHHPFNGDLNDIFKQRDIKACVHLCEHGILVTQHDISTLKTLWLHCWFIVLAEILVNTFNKAAAPNWWNIPKFDWSRFLQSCGIMAFLTNRQGLDLLSDRPSSPSLLTGFLQD